MAYESNLNAVVPIFSLIPGSYVYSSATSGLSATFSVNISGTTLGNTLPDEDCKLFVQTSFALPSGLSATNSTSLYLNLSSATQIPTAVQYIGNVATSTIIPAISSSTLTINFPTNLDSDNINLRTTFLYLSGNSTTINLDPTQNTTLDNFFFVSTNPAETSSNKPNTVRTTSGHARLVAFNG